MRPGAVMRQVIGEPDGLRPEPGTWPVRRTTIERRADDHYVRARPGRRVCQLGPLHTEERRVRAVHATKPRHMLHGIVHRAMIERKEKLENVVRGFLLRDMID